MSNVYLVRHGQAGTRDAYDSLSELGKRQARLLGEYFVSRGIQFSSACTGELLRQQQTAEEINAAYLDAGVHLPAISVDPGWNEFDLGQVYREIAPQLGVEDLEFRREYQEMCEEARANAGSSAAPVHRKWRPCDTKLVDAWIRGRYAYSGETWSQFRERVAACQLKMDGKQQHENVLVVTSATPIAIWIGMSLDIFDERVMRLAGASFNASYTILGLREAQLRLFTFNAVPHLAAPGLCTRR